MGIPPLICAWREGIWPWPACSTWPITTWSTCSGSTPARSSAALIASPPSSVASSEARPPPILPMGVRAAPRITVLGMGAGSPGVVGERTGVGMVVDEAPAAAARERSPSSVAHPGTTATTGDTARERPRRLDIVRDRAGIDHHATRRRTPTPTRSRSASSTARSRPRGRPGELGELLDSGEARRSFKALALTHARGQALAGRRARRARAVHRRARARGGRGACTRARARSRPARSAGRRRPTTDAARSPRRSSRARSSRDYRFDQHKSSRDGRDAARRTRRPSTSSA